MGRNRPRNGCAIHPRPDDAEIVLRRRGQRHLGCPRTDRPQSHCQRRAFRRRAQVHAAGRLVREPRGGVDEQRTQLRDRRFALTLLIFERERQFLVVIQLQIAQKKSSAIYTLIVLYYLNQRIL